MSKIKTAIHLLKSNRSAIFSTVFMHFAKARVSHLIPDKTYLKLQYRANVHKKLNLKNPKTFNEKLQWLKLYNRKSEYTQMVDKYVVRKYIAKTIGEEYLVPLIGVWDNANDMDFDSLPDQFVLKCNHDSGSVIICKDKNKFNRDEAIKKLNEHLRKEMFYWSREWPYRNIKRKIICEQYMQDNNFDVLSVYKIFNFNNGPQIVQMIQNDKTDSESIDYFDTNWNLLELRQNFPNSQKPLSKPQTLEKMLELAKTLSEGFPFLRTDFYEINGKVYFSEFTFFSDAGLARFEPEKWDKILGNRIDLSGFNQQ